MDFVKRVLKLLRWMASLAIVSARFRRACTAAVEQRGEGPVQREGGEMTDFNLKARAREACGVDHRLVFSRCACERIQSALRDALQAAEDVARAKEQVGLQEWIGSTVNAYVLGRKHAADAIQQLRTTTQSESRDTGSRSVCPTCGGSGDLFSHFELAGEVKKCCPACGGNKEQVVGFDPTGGGQEIIEPCSACGGDGKGAASD